MTVRFVRPVSQSAYTGRRLGFSALLLFVIIVIGHRFGPLSEPTFVALLLLSATIATAALLFSLIGLVRLWQAGARGGIAAAKGLIYAAIPLGTVAVAAYDYRHFPALYEVSTDLEDPPAWIAAPKADQGWLARRATLGPADRRAQFSAYPTLIGRRYEGAIDRVYDGVQKAARAARITITGRQGIELIVPETPGRTAPRDDQTPVPDVAPVPLPRPEPAPTPVYGNAGDVLLQGETRTLVLGLRFDLVIRLHEDAETTSVDIRVSSRYADHDLGIGERIAETFLDRLDQELLGIAGN
ncbi:MAG: DUF1499 domain-containing protein [Neorhizobium sp.]|nr:DUF1499 domain-containing protein [Neorhizobium sp.]